MRKPSRADIVITARTLSIGAVGAAAAWAIHMPMGFLIGPALFVSVISLRGVQSNIMPALQNVMFMIIGLTVGSMVTPTSIEVVLRWPIAFSLLALMTLASPYLGQWILQRMMGFNKDEAFMSATPGHLSFVVSISETLGISVMRPAILASFRLLSLSLMAPLLAYLANADVGPGLPLGNITADAPDLAVQLVCALALVPVLKRLQLPAPVLLAPMITAAGFHLSGLTTGGLPTWLSQLTLIGMGSLIGTRFSGVTWADLRHNFKAALIILILSLSLALIAAVPAAYLSQIPLSDILIGFAPGALETMLIVGVAMGADPSFVATAHVVRLFVLALVITGYATHITRRQKR